MVRVGHSPQTVAVLRALTEDGWHHGYDLAKRAGLKSGALYPILVRLADRGLVKAQWEEAQWEEAQWEQAQPAGRPRRHLYRLTAQGAAARAQAQPRSARPKRTRPW